MCTRRFLGVERDCENPNSGVVQVVKGDSSNAWELFAHLPLIRTHLGKGLSSNVTLKEMYLGNRRLLGTLKGADVEHFMQLLLQDRNPQYIDFLLSICICDDEPLPSNQELVCEQLLNLNAHLLPTCQVEAARESGELRLGIHLPGAKDQHGRDFWIDVCKFTETREWRAGEGVRDLGNWFLSVGATSSGQHFHSHGEALNAVVWGRKRWFFLAPGSSVRASDYASSLEFVRGLPANRREGASVAECVQERGDVVIVPAQLPHAVVNDGDTVSVSLDRV